MKFINAEYNIMLQNITMNILFNSKNKDQFNKN